MTAMPHFHAIVQKRAAVPTSNPFVPDACLFCPLAYMDFGFHRPTTLWALCIPLLERGQWDQQGPPPRGRMNAGFFPSMS